MSGAHWSSRSNKEDLKGVVERARNMVTKKIKKKKTDNDEGGECTKWRLYVSESESARDYETEDGVSEGARR